MSKKFFLFFPNSRHNFQEKYAIFMHKLRYVKAYSKEKYATFMHKLRYVKAYSKVIFPQQPLNAMRITMNSA